MESVFVSSQLMILDFGDIPSNTPPQANIQNFFKESQEKGYNPRLPEYRQRFNNSFLKYSQKRYLVSRYGEDRSAMLAGTQIADEGRTIHMGMDIFSRDLEAVYAPCKGEVLRTAYEAQDHGYGYYLVFKPDEADVYFFFGHLSKNFEITTGRVEAGQHIATLGDFTNNENGGWSRHLHLQVTKELPPQGKTPDGYSTRANFASNSQKFPDPMQYFPDWHIN